MAGDPITSYITWTTNSPTVEMIYDNWCVNADRLNALIPAVFEQTSFNFIEHTGLEYLACV